MIDRQAKDYSYALSLLWVFFFVILSLVLIEGAHGQDVDDDLDLPVLPPVYRSPEEREVRPIPDVSPPEQPPVDLDPQDEPPVLFFGEEIATEGSTLVYVLDFSGSMGEYTSGVIIVQISPTSTTTIAIFYTDRLKEEFARSVRALSQNMRFNVVVFDCNVIQWADALRPATTDFKEEAVAWVQARRPQGGTGTGAAVSAALQDPAVEAVILLTDGVPTCPTSAWEEHREMIRQNNSRHVPIHCFGMGTIAIRSPFLNAVAADSGGTFVALP